MKIWEFEQNKIRMEKKLDIISQGSEFGEE